MYANAKPYQIQKSFAGTLKDLRLIAEAITPSKQKLPLTISVIKLMDSFWHTKNHVTKQSSVFKNL